MHNSLFSLRFSLKSCFLAAALALSSVSAHAAGHGSSVGVTVVCSCDDPTGQSYGKAVLDLITRDPHFRQVSEADAGQQDAIQIHIISQPLGTPGQEAISVVYTYDGAFLHQFIETTCTKVPLMDSAAAVVRQMQEMEKDVQELARQETAAAVVPPRAHRL